MLDKKWTIKLFLLLIRVIFFYIHSALVTRYFRTRHIIFQTIFFPFLRCLHHIRIIEIARLNDNDMANNSKNNLLYFVM